MFRFCDRGCIVLELRLTCSQPCDRGSLAGDMWLEFALPGAQRCGGASQSSTEVQDAGGLPLLEYEFMSGCKHVKKFSLPAELSIPHATAQTHWVSKLDQPLPSLFT